MTHNVQTIAKDPETHPLPVSIIEMWVVIAINMAWLVISLVMQ
jgi:hypothetical protein